MSDEMSTGRIIPIATKFTEKEQLPQIWSPYPSIQKMGTPPDLHVELTLVIDGHVQIHELYVLNYQLSKRLATPAELRFADKVRSLFADLEEGIYE